MIGLTLDRAVASGAGTVDEVLDAFFADRVQRATAHGDDYTRLWEAARDATAGGKRIRPELALAAYSAFADAGSVAGSLDGSVDAGSVDAVRLAAAFELLHTAFLMHDDVIDHDLVRRGVPNVAGRFALDAIGRGLSTARAHEYGEASAILAGDLLISSAHRLVAELDAPRGIRNRLLEIIDECVFLAAAGEHADVHQAGAAPGEREILTMIENKTASYSFSAPLQAGAVLAGAPADAVECLGEIGRELGVAFQLRDDVLGVYGTAAVTGKSVFGDLREGKETLLIAYARQHDAWSAVAGDFGRADLDDAAAGRLRATIESSGALARVEQLIAARCAGAIDAIAAAGLPARLRDGLSASARDCVERVR
ncbi:polyprenyl synthetase family protein [Agromyces subbeticus]|uniref:polyprenyl synthetase family protein n=1 Tax=Agromyces subbeticus TaxID=293890 RepID=UPI0003B57CFF|nr:polyprenyl synthetase family protein [Agromyces subbeticus]